jgi:hypothetical protein
MQKSEIQTVELVTKDYMVAHLISRGITGGDLKMECLYRADLMAHQLVARLRLLGDPSEPKVIASYPATLWDHIKKSLGLKHHRVWVMQEDTILYPQLEIPQADKVLRVYTHNWHTRDTDDYAE